jgi:hypothetical protein
MPNKKIFADLAELTTSAADDVLPIVDDTTGTPTTKHITVANLMVAAPVQSVAGRDGVVTLSNTDISGLGTAATSASTDFSPAFFSTVSETTTARTLSDSDNGKVIVCSNASSINITVPDTLTSGFSCTIVQSGAGQVTIATSGSATIFGYSGNLSTAGQYASLNIIPTGSNAYLVEGELGAGPFNNNFSLELDGIDDYATLGTTYSALSGNKSICGWFYFDSVSSRTIFAPVGASSFSSEGWQILNSSSIRFRVGSTRHIFTVPTLSTGTWYHLAVTGDGTDLKLYINGTQQGGDKVDGDWSIGEFFRTSTFYRFDGYVDEIGLWTGTTLSSSDVSSIANLGAASGDKAVDLSAYTGLTHWWRFGDGDSSPTVSDNVGSNNMTLINSPTFVSQVP